MIASIFIPAKLGISLAVATGVPTVYYVALFVKQVLLKKPGGLFTAKF
jgi:hypothetical protein